MRPRRATLAVVALAVLAGCSVDPGVVSVGAQQAPGVSPAAAPDESTTAEVPSTPSTDATGSDATGSDPASEIPTATDSPLPKITEPELFTAVAVADVIDVDDNRPAKAYDDFLAVAVADVERWWSEVYPQVYGEPFEPLDGGIFAGYPERQTDIPGCGERVTAYDDLTQFGAFYCQLGDFIAFDDGDASDLSILAPMAAEFGPAVLGVVLAHEYGHAIQARIGALDDFLDTIFTEQQADCFAGAWVGQAYRGESPLLRLGDADVRTGLIAMLEVRDPVGTNQFVPGGHGSAFDRVGAFQVGFVEGPARCAELLDTPLTLMPNEFQTTLDLALEGNAPYDCEELRNLGATQDEIDNCTPAPVFLADDLNDFWADVLGAPFTALTPQPVSSIGAAGCDQPIVVADEVVLCDSTNSVVFDEPEVLSLYRDFGDFTLGYFYGVAWADRAQTIEGSTLTGEARALRNDCYTGAWVADITPDANGETRRSADTDGDGFKETGIRISPGDLDEAIRMAILLGDAGANVDQIGSPFEKIASFRAGVLGGLDACR